MLVPTSETIRGVGCPSVLLQLHVGYRIITDNRPESKASGAQVHVSLTSPPPIYGHLAETGLHDRSIPRGIGLGTLMFVT
jgi:hypothetical protein